MNSETEQTLSYHRAGPKNTSVQYKDIYLKFENVNQYEFATLGVGVGSSVECETAVVVRTIIS